MKHAFLNRMSKLAALLVLVFFLAGCEKNDDIAPQAAPDNAAADIEAVLQQFNDGNPPDIGQQGAEADRRGYRIPTFFTLATALVQTNLLRTVVVEELTLFAPTDQAFAELGLNPQNIGSVPNLREILLYHVIAGKVRSTDLSEGFAHTLNGAAVEIDLSKGVMVNGENVLFADIHALNGVIHVIDGVLLPPTKNLVELAISFNPEFSILVDAVQRAGLVETLAEGGPFTVFAPTNSAFVALLNELGASSLDDIPVDLLRSVLLYHVVPGRVFSSDLTDGPVSTANGQAFTVDLSELELIDANGREAGLIPSLLNVQATNGVVHVIDRVILPNLGS